MGETAVLAMERKPATAMLDDAAARTRAKALEIEVIGTLGVVLRAKRKAFIPSAADVLKALRMTGFHLNDEAARSALQRMFQLSSSASCLFTTS